MDLGMGKANQQAGAGAANMLLQIAEMQEHMLDEEIQQLDTMGDGDYAKLRAKRLADMRKQSEAEKEWSSAGHGTYTELTDTKEFFSTCKGSKRCAVHFYRPTSRFCEQMDGMMSKLAGMHKECKFAKIAAEKSPYLCEKLLADPDGNVVIPTVLLCIDGKVVYHVRGFEEIGGAEAGPASLGLIMALNGVIDAEAGDDEYNNAEGAPLDMDEYRQKAIREGGFGSIDSDDDLSDDGGTVDAHDA